MIEKFKLKHLDLLTEDKIDYARLMVEVDGYKNTWWNKRFGFMGSYKRTYSLIKYIQNLDPLLIDLDPGCKILIPENIDDISFSAMMELQMLLNNSSDLGLGELMAESIAIVCFSANSKLDFKIDSIAYNEFKSLIMDTSATQMMGISNWIHKSLKESTNHWQQKFFEVEVIDEDYKNAGGEKMNAFNIVNTIKALCTDFNVTYEEAWQLSYSLTQINSLSKATYGFIQHHMSKIKEAKMRANRKKP